MDPMSPMVYIVKQGAASLVELTQFKGKDPDGYAQLRQYALDEMALVGIPVKVQ